MALVTAMPTPKAKLDFYSQCKVHACMHRFGVDHFNLHVLQAMVHAGMHPMTGAQNSP